MEHPPLIAVDIGNSRTKFGLFERIVRGTLPQPLELAECPTETLLSTAADSFLDALLTKFSCASHNPTTPPAWSIASVHRGAAQALIRHLSSRSPQSVRVLQQQDFAIKLAIQQPETLGIDRIAGAVAANVLRQPHRAAIVIDLGTALTVDLISAEGIFCGGAIAPGIGLSARALHDFTDQLPLIPMSELSTPVPALGESTIPALRSGLYWGTIGAMRELIHQLSAGQSQAPDVFLTGGAAPHVANLIGPTAQFVLHLVLAGIALAAEQKSC